MARIVTSIPDDCVSAGGFTFVDQATYPSSGQIEYVQLHKPAPGDVVVYRGLETERIRVGTRGRIDPGCLVSLAYTGRASNTPDRAGADQTAPGVRGRIRGARRTVRQGEVHASGIAEERIHADVAILTSLIRHTTHPVAPGVTVDIAAGKNWSASGMPQEHIPRITIKVTGGLIAIAVDRRPARAEGYNRVGDDGV